VESGCLTGPVWNTGMGLLHNGLSYEMRAPVIPTHSVTVRWLFSSFTWPAHHRVQMRHSRHRRWTDLDFSLDG